MTYRKATSEDIPALTKLREDFIGDAGSLAAHDIQAMACYPDFLQEGLQNGSFVQWLAELDGQIIATGSISFYRLPPRCKLPNGQAAYIGNMFTYPAYRRQGISRNILQLLVDEAKALGCHEIWLDASPQGKPLYERFGFETREMMKFYL